MGILGRECGQALDPGQLPRQAYGLQIIVASSECPRLLPKACAGRGVFQKSANGGAHLCSIEEFHQAAGLIIADGFSQRRGVTGYDGTAYAHGFKQTPAQHKGVGQIDMDTGQLKHGDELFVGNGREPSQRLRSKVVLAQ